MSLLLLCSPLSVFFIFFYFLFVCFLFLLWFHNHPHPAAYPPTPCQVSPHVTPICPATGSVFVCLLLVFSQRRIKIEQHSHNSNNWETAQAIWHSGFKILHDILQYLNKILNSKNILFEEDIY